jgi:drug/metabolite transporter (DMT)-like permease
MTTTRTYRLGIILVIAAAVAWSTSGLFTRALTADTSTILFWRGLFGAIGTCILVAALPQTGGIKTFRSLGRPGLAYAALTAISMLLFISALRQTTVAHVAVITAIVPFMAALLGWMVLAERPHVAAIIASIAALIGVGRAKHRWPPVRRCACHCDGAVYGGHDLDFPPLSRHSGTAFYLPRLCIKRRCNAAFYSSHRSYRP